MIASFTTMKNRPQSPLLLKFRKKKTLSPSQTMNSFSSPAMSPSTEVPCSCRQFLSRRHATKRVWYGANPEDLPKMRLGELKPDIYASSSGPDSGLMFVHQLRREREETVGQTVAGSQDWQRANRKAFGMSTSLYERHPFSRRKAGEPIADSYAVLAATNCACLAVADGVNWGQKSRTASRCAVYAAMSYIHKKLFSPAPPLADPSATKQDATSTKDTPKDTQAVLQVMLEAFSMAQSTILRYEGGLTTLTLAMVLPLADDELAKGVQFCVCVVNLGDSLAYLLSKHHGIREISVGSHDIETARNIRDAGGALGPVYNGSEPELHNLTCSVTFADPGDILFLTSDGVSDNFDPVVTKLALPSCPLLTENQFPAADDCEDLIGPLHLTPAERHHYAMKAMEKALHEFELESQTEPCAQTLCRTLLKASYATSAEKRAALENPALYGAADRRRSEEERLAKHAMLSERLATCPGKLDHATVAAYEIGFYRGNDNEVYENTTDENWNSSLKAELSNGVAQAISLPTSPNPIRNFFRKKSTS